MNSFFDFTDAILGIVIVLGIPAYLTLQVWAATELKHGWRLAALAPLALVGIVLASIAAQCGLWQPAIFFAPAAAMYLLGLMGLRTIAAHHHMPDLHHALAA